MTIAAPNPAGWTPRRSPAFVPPVPEPGDDLAAIVDWTAAQDLALAEALTGGGGLDAAARRLCRERGACLRRWRALLPQVGAEPQERLLRRLRAEVESGDAPLRAGPARPFRRG